MDMLSEEECISIYHKTNFIGGESSKVDKPCQRQIFIQPHRFLTPVDFEFVTNIQKLFRREL
jgi:hypothetical protein